MIDEALRKLKLVSKDIGMAEDNHGGAIGREFVSNRLCFLQAFAQERRQFVLNGDRKLKNIRIGVELTAGRQPKREMRE